MAPNGIEGKVKKNLAVRSLQDGKSKFQGKRMEIYMTAVQKQLKCVTRLYTQTFQFYYK